MSVSYYNLRFRNVFLRAFIEENFFKAANFYIWVALYLEVKMAPEKKVSRTSHLYAKDIFEVFLTTMLAIGGASLFRPVTRFCDYVSCAHSNLI